MILDDSLLKYHYRQTNGWTDNAKSRVAFATENQGNPVGVLMYSQTMLVVKSPSRLKKKGNPPG